LKILLVGNFNKDQQFSMQKFTDCLADNLIKHGHEVRVSTPRTIASVFCKATVSGGAKWLGYVDKYLFFPISLKLQAKWADIVHICDHSNAMYIPYIKHQPHLVTCHDLMAVRSALGEFPQNSGVGKSGQLQQKWIVKGLAAANHIASVSGSTQNDLQRFVGSSVDCRVIYNGLNYPFKPMASQEAQVCLQSYSITDGSPFLLHIGGNQWYKNRLGLIKIYAQLIKQTPGSSLKLVLAGKPFSAELRGLIQRYGLDNRVIEVTGASTEQLRALYSLAEAFVFPSIYEGFGWPIIEAMACETLVFTSNRAPMNEIGGKAAIYIDPGNATQAATTILEALNSPAIIKQAKHHAPVIIDKFSTDNMVKNYIHYYQHILKQALL